MLVFVYSSYQKLSFQHLVVILTTLETPKTPNIKTAARQVWLYFICRTTWPGYAGTNTNLQIVLNTQKNPYLNQATPKNTCQIFLPKKIPESKVWEITYQGEMQWPKHKLAYTILFKQKAEVASDTLYRGGVGWNGVREGGSCVQRRGLF